MEMWLLLELSFYTFVLVESEILYTVYLHMNNIICSNITIVFQNKLYPTWIVFMYYCFL